MPILKNVLGLDLGSHSLKAVEIQQSLRTLEAVHVRAAKRSENHPLPEVIARIDGTVPSPPAYYAVNCVHPSLLRDALRGDERLRRLAGGRLLGFKPNASRRPPAELAALDHLEAEAPERLADEMDALRDEFGLRVLGGCCGTDHRHIESLAGRLVAGSTGTGP